MRFRGAVGAAPRMVVEDIELDGYRVPAGTMLSLSTSAANHDPDAYDEPADLRHHRRARAALHLRRRAPLLPRRRLARAEMQEALPILAEAMPDLALDGEPTWRPPFGIFGPDTLPLRFGA